MLLLGKILYIEKKNFNIACQNLDIMDEYFLFEYLLFNIHFSPCIHEKTFHSNVCFLSAVHRKLALSVLFSVRKVLQ